MPRQTLHRVDVLCAANELALFLRKVSSLDTRDALDRRGTVMQEVLVMYIEQERTVDISKRRVMSLCRIVLVNILVCGCD